MKYIYVAIFGALGAATRCLMGLVVGMATSGAFPYSTLAVNLIGSFLLVFTMEFFLTRSYLPHDLVRYFGIGFIGSFTTFSAFSTEVVLLVIEKEYVVAASYGFLSVVGGISAAGLGFCLGNRKYRLEPRKSDRDNGLNQQEQEGGTKND